MASQSQLDALAQSKGFSSYFKYRDFLAKQMGYANYSAQRKARSTGIGLKGADANNPKYLALKQETETKVVAKILSIGPDVAPVTAAALATAVEAGDTSKAKEIITPLLDRYKALGNDITNSSFRLLEMNPYKAKLFAASKTADAVIKDLQDRVGKLTAYTESFFTKGGIQQVYLEAAKAASGSDLYQLTEHDKEVIAQLGQQGLQATQTSGFFTYRSLKTNLTQLAATPASSVRGPVGFVRANKVAAAVYSDGQRHTLQDYMSMSLRSLSSRAVNLATLNATQAGFYVVSDGTSCGWTEHNDPDTADGTVRSFEECASQPISHPNCVRSFSPSPTTPEDDQSLGRRAVAYAKAHEAQVAVGAATAAAVTALAVSSDLRMAVAGVLTDVGQDAASHYQRVNQWLQDLKTQYIDYSTIKALQSMTPQQIADEAASYAQEFLQTGELPAHVESMLETYRASFPELKYASTADSYWTFMTMQDLTENAKLSAADLITKENLQKQIYNALNHTIGGYGNDFARLTFPQIGGPGRKRRTGRISINPNDFLKFTATQTKQGILSRLGLNPDGILRAGLIRDPATGLISGDMRFVPPGPLRIEASLNRSEGHVVTLDKLRSYDRDLVRSLGSGETATGFNGTTLEKLQGVGKNGYDLVRVGRGRVTSVSFEARLVLPLKVDLSTTFRANLRALNIYKLADIKKLTLGDLRRLNIDPSFLKMVSVAVQYRGSGFNWFGLSKTLRMSWDDAQKLWELTNVWIRNNFHGARDIFNALQFEKGGLQLAVDKEGNPISGNLFSASNKLIFTTPGEGNISALLEKASLMKQIGLKATLGMLKDDAKLVLQGIAANLGSDTVDVLERIAAHLPETTPGQLLARIGQTLGFDIPDAASDAQARLVADNLIFAGQDVTDEAVRSAAKRTIVNDLYDTIGDKLSLEDVYETIRTEFDFPAVFGGLSDFPAWADMTEPGKTIVGVLDNGDGTVTLKYGPQRIEDIYVTGMREAEDMNPKLEFLPIENPIVQEAMKKHLINKLVGQWAISSNDLSAISVLIQQRAAEMFGLQVQERLQTEAEVLEETLFPFHKYNQGAITPALLDEFTRSAHARYTDFLGELASATANDHLGNVVSEFLQGVYKNTQETLRAANIEEVTVYRGMRFTEIPTWAKDVWDKESRSVIDMEEWMNKVEDYLLAQGQKKIPKFLIDERPPATESWNPIDLSLQPLSSTALTYETAQLFATDYGTGDFGFVVKFKVPVAQIFSTSRTGIGALIEDELVVLGSDGHALIQAIT